MTKHPKIFDGLGKLGTRKFQWCTQCLWGCGPQKLCSAPIHVLLAAGLPALVRYHHISFHAAKDFSIPGSSNLSFVGNTAADDRTTWQGY
jgi:hypothetical protein